MRFVCGVLLLLLALFSQNWPNVISTLHAAENDVPRFLVDPYWPKPLPNRWVTGAVGGVCVDRQDHIIGVNRIDLTEMEQKVGKQSAPVVIEYDVDGHIANAWSDPKLLPHMIHGCLSMARKTFG